MQLRRLQRFGIAALIAGSFASCESNSRRTPYADNPLVQARQPIVAPQTGASSLAKTAPTPESKQVVEIPRSSIPRQPDELASKNPQPIAQLPPPLAPIVGPISPPSTTMEGEQSTAPPKNRIMEGRFGHATDHTWLQGELDRHYRGQFELRFRPASVDDPIGGKVRLDDHCDLGQFRVGDVVAVEGELMPESEPSNASVGTSYRRYRITAIRLVQRP